ncbi:hypothetical protein LCGC14_2272620, partial [marine sediment metagenome]
YSSMPDVDFEMLMIGVYDHIKWESLEGGPYIKMESIGEGNGIAIKGDIGKILDVYDHTAVKLIYKKLKEYDLTILKDAFILKMIGNKEVTYVLNKQLFIERFVTILDQYFIMDINGEYDLIQYAYVPIDRIFQRHDTMLASPDSWKHLVKKGKERIEHFPITYMNGKYIRQHVIETADPGTPLKRTIISFHPALIMYIAKVIHYHLLNELKNVKNKL